VELPRFTMLCVKAAPDECGFTTSMEVQRVLRDRLGRRLQQAQGPPERGLESLQLGQETVSLPFDSQQSPVPTLTVLSFPFVCVRGHFILCFAGAIATRFLQLSSPVMPLSWDSCCQEKMALTLKQR